MSLGVEGAIVLGAGLGRRMNRGPKAFVELSGHCLARRVVTALSEAGIPRVVLVLPPTAGSNPELDGIDSIVNPHAAGGPLSSVVLGLAALDRDSPVERAIVHPVDHPLVTDVVIRQLVEVGRGVNATVSRVVPTWQGRRGHPVLVCGVGLEALRALGDPNATTLRDELRRAGETVEVAVHESSVLQNLNTEQALDAARRQLKVYEEA